MFFVRARKDLRCCGKPPESVFGNKSAIKEENAAAGQQTPEHPTPKTERRSYRTPALKKLRDAFFQHHDTIFDACFFRFFFEKLQRFIDRLMRKAKAAIVHGNHPA
jgi:hypothetical protein